MRFTIKSDDVKGSLGIPPVYFPKYTTQIINLAGQNSGATRPKVVGQMSDLTVESDARSLDEWEGFYRSQRPDAPVAAADKIENMVENIREAMELVDREMIDRWVEDLLINKTYYGFRAQDAILEHMSNRLGLPLRQATPADEICKTVIIRYPVVLFLERLLIMILRCRTHAGEIGMMRAWDKH